MAHDKFGVWTSKTAHCVLRYSKDYQAVAVLDRSKAGHDASEFVGDVGKGVPVVGHLRDALALDPEVLIIGIAPVGGGLPEDWRAEIRMALDAGVDVISGLHAFLADDPEFSEAARRGGAKIWDVRRPTKPDRIATGEGRFVEAPVVHTIGTDCSSGKMTVSVEIVRAAQRRGIDAAFAATGQTGIMIGCDAGAPVDRIVSDFVNGAAEELVLECARKGKELIVVEGQGATTHPAYSGVAVGLLHGCFPDLLVLCHQVGRVHKRGFGEPDRTVPILSLRAEIDLAEALLKPVTGGKVVAIALATHGLPEDEARAAIRRAERETGLPATDAVRYGADVLVDAILEACWKLPKKGVERLRRLLATKPI